MPLYQHKDIILNGKYKIEKLLGAGAFGEVYLATHLDLGVQRAIKVAHRNMPGFASSRFEEAFDRFRQEAQIGARIKNDHIIQIHDFENGEESLHLVMEYASGGSLEEKLITNQKEEKTFSVEESLKIIHDIADGLAVLHDKRNPIIHRDLKPSNILFDGEGNAKIADLGLAQVQGGLSQRTRLGSLAQPHPGTPAYMSPEQESSYGMLRSTSDIYSVGVMWFEMLSGVNYNMQPPGTRIVEFRDHLTDELIKLIEDMLLKDADQRLWDGKRLLERIEILKTGNIQTSQGKNISQPARQSDTATKQPDYPGKTPDEKEVKKGSSVSIAKQEKQTPPSSSQSQPKEKQSEGLKVTEGKGNKVIDLGDGVQMEFVYVPAGEFWMGADESDPVAKVVEKPKHKVYLDAYWIGKYPVTNRQYTCFINETNHKRPEHWKNGQIPNNKEDHPVVNVSWHDVETFTKWMSKKCGVDIKLPTEAQWEKAARGTDGRKYPWGNEAPNGMLLNFNRNIGKTTAIDSYPEGASPYDAMDMAGNVYEWVRDWFNLYCYSKSPPENPTGPTSGDVRMLRGGCWEAGESIVRSSYRDGYYPGDTNLNSCGFRCAASD